MHSPARQPGPGQFGRSLNVLGYFVNSRRVARDTDEINDWEQVSQACSYRLTRTESSGPLSISVSLTGSTASRSEVQLLTFVLLRMVHDCSSLTTILHKQRSSSVPTKQISQTTSWSKFLQWSTSANVKLLFKTAAVRSGGTYSPALVTSAVDESS